MKVLDEHVPIAVDILSDIVLRPAFHEVDIEREKKVILEEIKMVEDTPDDLVHEIFTQAFWEGHPLGRPILGTKESVEALHASSGCATISAAPTRPRTSSSRPPATSSTRSCAPRSRRRLARCPPPGCNQTSGPPHVIPKVIIRNKELEQSHVCLGTVQLSAEPRATATRATS